MKSKDKYNARIHFLDTLRGVIIIGIIIYHLLFDLSDIFSLNLPFLGWGIFNFIRDSGAGLMIILCGISCNFSHNNVKRGLICLGVALAFSLVTYFFLPNEFIYFGILHFLSIAILLYSLIHKFIERIPWYVAIILYVIFILIFMIPEGKFGLFGFKFADVPIGIDNVVTYCFGVPGYTGRISADYFPIIPWMLLFLSGAILGRYVKAGKIPKWWYKDYCKPVTFVGTKTLYIYVLHQPILYGVLSLIFYLMDRGQS